MRYLLLCLAFTLVTCADDDTEQIESHEARMTQIAENVEAMTINKSCNGVDDCASIAWGSKPCGGPWAYLVYAPSNVDVSQLEQLVQEYNQLQKEVNQLKGLASDCAVVTEPALECVENECKAKL